uniref:Uncharacterized protein n=1 Tax=Scleropages formosus TaxID=113540 RepID=A0A8C9S7C9_SCLFO
VHPLDDVPAVVEDAADVLRVHGAREMRIAVVPPVPTGRAHPLQKTRRELIAYEVLCPSHLRVLNMVVVITVIWCGVARELWKVFLYFRLPCQNFLSQQVLFVEEHRGTLPVVPDVLEEVQTAAGHHKNNGSDICKQRAQRAAMEKGSRMMYAIWLGTNAPARGPGTPLEMGGKHSRESIGQTLAIVILTLFDQLVLIGPLKAGPHPFVLPQRLGMFVELLPTRGYAHTANLFK